MGTTDNYGFVKHHFGYPVRDDELGDNLDLIDAAIKAREDETDETDALEDGKIIVGNASDVASDVTMSGDVTIIKTGETSIGADKVTKVEIAADVAGDGLTQAEGGELDVNVDGSTIEVATDVVGVKNAGITIVKLEASLLKDIGTLSMSFENNEQTATKLYFPFKVTINKIRSIVMLALGGADAGTITGANSTGNSANGVVTVAASALLNEEDSASPTTNNVVLADSYYKLTTAKSTAGGKVLVTLEFTRTA